MSGLFPLEKAVIVWIIDCIRAVRNVAIIAATSGFAGLLGLLVFTWISAITGSLVVDGLKDAAPIAVAIMIISATCSLIAVVIPSDECLSLMEGALIVHENEYIKPNPRCGRRITSLDMLFDPSIECKSFYFGGCKKALSRSFIFGMPIRTVRIHVNGDGVWEYYPKKGGAK